MVIYDAASLWLKYITSVKGTCSSCKKQGYCFLLSSSNDPQAIERLKKMEELKDGFEVSNYDLHMRGPGDILGIRQSGMPCLVFGDFEKDPGYDGNVYSGCKRNYTRSSGCGSLVVYFECD